ncbi:MAG: hypothetical protein OET55_00080 [Desulfuromonadales bacterium]|nr:hypothetical protein [Desulfuromonadales bacterium]MDH3867753.1 hypothetical protein [Desulfuromonadales bacterium]MDH3959652.1 hypothetical protein [Desulfuromonadales bacterium]MDH4024403.1 hypothetical protein [Desulfuromonadales bacterium]
MKLEPTKRVGAGQKPFLVSSDDIASDVSDFYSHAIPELWSLKLKARQIMDSKALPSVANQ